MHMDIRWWTRLIIFCKGFDWCNPCMNGRQSCKWLADCVKVKSWVKMPNDHDQQMRWWWLVNVLFHLLPLKKQILSACNHRHYFHLFPWRKRWSQKVKRIQCVTFPYSKTPLMNARFWQVLTRALSKTIGALFYYFLALVFNRSCIIKAHWFTRRD